MLQGGVPIYWDRSDRVYFEAKSVTSKSKAALDRAEEKASKSKTPNHGRIFYPVPHTIDDGPLPTLAEWMEEQANKETETGYRSKFQSANPVYSNAPEGP